MLSGEALPRLPYPAPSLKAGIRALLFDLDGTLLDTAADLIQTGHVMREIFRLAPLSDAQILSFVGKGAERFVHRLLTGDLSADAEASAHAIAMQHFSDVYRRYNGQWARPYAGVVHGLEQLKAAGFPMAVVTNKAQAFTDALLVRSDLSRYFRFALGGDALPFKKPRPEPLWQAASMLGFRPSEVLMLGDSQNDAQAARAAGMLCFLVPYGYREGVDLEQIACDGIVPDIKTFAQWTLQASHLPCPAPDAGDAVVKQPLGSDVHN
ncbi:MAG: HAD family hydrolase [Betaproteobacteria bacterium]|nr:HAD family hydrolase [Betaproteobacteria bacterium]NBU67547.1 HAD family hydrolase [Betaproteobacteria bacterium]NCV60670.1 HAD family hydrolase [Betaproteobacteria bacterium]